MTINNQIAHNINNKTYSNKNIVKPLVTMKQLLNEYY